MPPGAHLLATNWVTVPPAMRSRREDATSSVNLPDKATKGEGPIDALCSRCKERAALAQL